MPPPRLQRPASRIRPLSAVAHAPGLDVEIYDEISEKILPCERFGAFATDRVYFFASFFRYMFSDLQPMGGVGYPAGVAIVDACVGGFVLGSERN